MGVLDGKVAIVTGASRGIGKGCALELGAAGAAVYLTGRTLAEGSAPLPASAESQRFSGRAVVALASDPECLRRSGSACTSHDLALEYGFRDVDGRLPAGPLHGRPRRSARA